MTSTLDYAVLERRITAAEQAIAELRSARSPSRSTDPSLDAMNLHEGLVARGPLPERTAQGAYGRAAVRRALADRLAYRDSSAHPPMLTAERSTEAGLRRIADAIADGPQPVAILRTLPMVNKNTLSELLLLGIHEGHFRRGRIITGKAGQPQVIVARADRPLPTHWDTHKVDWDRA